MISISTMVNAILYLIVAGAVWALLAWLIEYVGIPEPFKKTAKIILAVMAVLIVIGVLLGLVGGQPIFRP